jgi:hypothetical protein
MDDRFGGREVRLADFQVNHVVAGGLQLIGPRQQRHHMERFDRTTARTIGLSHWPSFNEGKETILPICRNEREPVAVTASRTLDCNKTNVRSRID